MATQVDAAADAAIRAAAFRQVERLVRIHGGYVPVSELRKKFSSGGNEFTFIHQKGIHRPAGMRYVLTLVSSPKASTIKYRDQGRSLEEFFNQGYEIEYDLMRDKSVKGMEIVNIKQNRSLYEAMEDRVPLLFFIRFAADKFFAVPNAFVTGFDPYDLKCRLSFGAKVREEEGAVLYDLPETQGERARIMQRIREDLHHELLKDRLAEAYGSRCAISDILGYELVDAASIRPEPEADLGLLQVTNGILLSKLHCAAFDANLIGIDQDYQVHVAGRLTEVMKARGQDLLAGALRGTLRLPAKKRHRPDQDRLRERFDEYRQANH